MARVRCHGACFAVYRQGMEQSADVCALCGDPIAVGEAWMEADEDGARKVAHSGCVYRDEEPDQRERWSPGIT